MEGSLGYIERLSLKNNNKKKYRKPSSPRSTISSAGFHLSEQGVRGRRGQGLCLACNKGSEEHPQKTALRENSCLC